MGKVAGSSGAQPKRMVTLRFNVKERSVIVLGIILLLIGFLAKIAIVWTLGIIVLVVGLILALLGSTGRPVRGRRHYF
jgi:uncharacterized membrane protein HdeD (DUF308 family)